MSEQAAKISGRIEGIGVPDLVWSLCQRKATGVLNVTRDSIRRTVYVGDGRIVFAGSSDPNDRLGETLLRVGAVDLEQLEQALRGLRSGKRIGTLLVEAGALSPDELVAAVLGQVRSTVLDLLTWERGEFEFVGGPLPSEEVITLQVSTPELLLRGVRNIRSFPRVRDAVGAPQSVFRLSAEAHRVLGGISLNESERLVLQSLERGPRAVAEMCDELGLSNFDVYQVMLAFRVLGVIERGRKDDDEAPDAWHAGCLGRSSLPHLLVRLSTERQTGVLYLSRGSTERSLHIRAGSCVFATSNKPDDSLLAHLFAKGVISLRDHEECVRRLLSNKRVGTILLELGVIDDAELGEMVRQQLSHIVYDSFTWDDGDFSFVPGPPPTVEEITIETGLATLVAEGVRRVQCWTRVIQGCGGIDQPLRLTPDYLEQLDAMNAGVEEWKVVNVLKSPMSPRRACRAVDLPDYRTCQVLWVLNVLGAAEPVPEGEVEELAPIEASTDEIAAVHDELRELTDRVEAVVAEPTTSPESTPEAAPAEPPEPVWEPPAAAGEAIVRFNAMHREVFRAVRTEVGAGAINFVRSCCGEVASEHPDLTAGVDLNSDGSWDTDGLRREIVRHRTEDPWSFFSNVLDQEFRDLMPHLGEHRAKSLKQRIWELQGEAGGAG